MSPAPPIKITDPLAPRFIPKINFAYGYYYEATCVRVRGCRLWSSGLINGRLITRLADRIDTKSSLSRIGVSY